MNRPAVPTRRRLPARSRQRGWVGLVAVLVALAIVGWLAKDALKRYGLIGGSPAVTRAATPGEPARAPGASAADSPDASGARTGAAGALERARGVEEMVGKAAAEREARGDRSSP